MKQEFLFWVVCSDCGIFLWCAMTTVLRPSLIPTVGYICYKLLNLVSELHQIGRKNLGLSFDCVPICLKPHSVMWTFETQL